VGHLGLQDENPVAFLGDASLGGGDLATLSPGHGLA
jgi:hypothetical protein